MGFALSRRPPAALLFIAALAVFVASSRFHRRQCIMRIDEAVDQYAAEHTPPPPPPTPLPAAAPPPRPTRAHTRPPPNLPPTEYRLYQKKTATNYSQVWMSPLEVNLVLRYLQNVESYLEWGSGGSTQNFPRWAKRAVSIEHDESWCETMRQKLIHDQGLRHVEYHCVPVARGYMGWGITNPFEEGNYTVFREYIDEVDKLNDESFDVVLIDGRARVDAAIKALSYLTERSVAILHDASRVWDSKTYEEVLRYYSIIESVGGDGKQGLAIMKRRSNLNWLKGNKPAVQQVLTRMYGSP